MNSISMWYVEFYFWFLNHRFTSQRSGDFLYLKFIVNSVYLFIYREKERAKQIAYTCFVYKHLILTGCGALIKTNHYSIFNRSILIEWSFNLGFKSLTYLTYMYNTEDDVFHLNSRSEYKRVNLNGILINNHKLTKKYCSNKLQLYGYDDVFCILYTNIFLFPNQQK